MKSILIERVSNGWIVRPFSPCTNWATAEAPNITVFTEIKDLQAALPDLLAENGANETAPEGIT